MNQYYQVNSTPELTNILSKLDKLKTEIYSLQSDTNGNLNNTIQNKLRYLWTYHSNAIEGSTLSLGDTVFFLQEGLTVQGKPFKDFLDAHNHSHAIDYALEVVHEKKPINAHLIRSLNTLLLMGIQTIPSTDANGQRIERKITPGQYQSIPNYLVQPNGSIHEYVPPFDVPQQVDDLCQWIQAHEKTLHPVIIASVAHYNMVRIHPFDDGNGRGARILTNIILMRAKFPPHHH